MSPEQIIILRELVQLGITPAPKPPVAMLMGPPGSGKTTLVSGLVKAWTAMGKTVVLTAFTGKAVDVLRRKTQHELCMTIDRLLMLDNVIECPCIVVDEFSQLEKVKFAALVRTFRHASCFVLTGDAYQLAPPGGKSLMITMLRANALPASRLFNLTRIYRQHNIDSCLSKNIDMLKTRIRDGVGMTDPASQFLCHDESFTYLPRVNDDAIRELSWSPRPQFLCTTNETRDRINILAQAQINEAAPSLGVLHPSLAMFRLGDVVICDSNCYDEAKQLLVPRGCMGVIRYVQNRTQIEYGNGFHDPFTTRWFRSKFDLAYCLSIDRAQGDEYTRVVVIVDGKRRASAKLLYTAISRAREECVVMGTPADIRLATSAVDKVDVTLYHCLM